MITRRTVRRTHLLRPDEAFNRLYRYCLAMMAKLFGIQIVAVMVLSTHEHLVLIDLFGKLSAFLQGFHRLVALGVKVLRKWEGSVWDSQKTSVVELRTPQAVIEKLAYIMANPVAAGLVTHAHEWPGITTRPEDLGRGQISATRSELYLNKKNPKWKKTAVVPLTLPDIGMSADELRCRVAEELERLERKARAETAAKGWRIKGRVRVLLGSPFETSKSWEPLRERNPHFAVGRGQRTAFFQAVAVLRRFRKAYREALEAWRAGDRDVEFPAGTWLMKVLHRVRVAPE